MRRLPILSPGCKYVGYGRVSTEDQNEAMQIDALVELGVAREQIYIDRASGRNLKRLQFQTARKALREGDVLVIWHLDRLTRSLADFERIVAEFQERKIGIYTVMGEVDLTTPSGRLASRIMMAVAEHDVELISLRTKAGQKAGRERGFHPGAPSKLTDAEWKKLFAELDRRPKRYSVKAWRIEVAKKWKIHEATVRGRLMKARRFETRDRRAAHDEAAD